MKIERYVRTVGGCASVSAAVLTLGSPSGAEAQTDVSWAAPVSGSWFDSGNWSPTQVPNNDPPDEFNAIIDVTGTAYIVSVDAGDVLISGFTLDSVDATVDGGGVNSLTVLGPGTISDGELANFDTVTFDALLTLSEARVSSNADVQANGGVDFANDDDGCTDICDSVINSSSDSSWNNGNIVLGGSSVFNNGNCSNFVINTDGQLIGAAGTQFNNPDGMIVKNSMGLTEFLGVTLNNMGTLDAAAGTFITDGVDVNGNGNTLGGGSWIVRDAATLDLLGQQAVVNAADVTIEGTGQFPAITNNILIIDPAGRLALDTSTSFVTPDDFTNDGELVLGDLQQFIVSGVLTNFLPGGELAGGVYDVGFGQLQFQGASIQILSSEIRVGDPNGITNLAGEEALSALSVISPSGLAQLFGGGAFVTQPPVLTVDGQLIVGEMADDTTLTATSGAGLVNLRGALTLDGDPNTGLGATLSVGSIGLGTINIADPNALLEGSGLVRAGTVETLGRIAPGRSAGQLIFEQSNVFIQPGANVDIEIGGAVSGLERDVIAVDLGTWQHVGGLAGTLNVTLIDGFAPPQGQFFDVIFASEGVLGEFENVVYDGPGSLQYIPGPNVVGVFICPADCNEDFQLDLSDFVCYQQTFQAGDPDADINGDGVLNILDFRAFQTIWVAGCDF